MAKSKSAPSASAISWCLANSLLLSAVPGCTRLWKGTIRCPMDSVTAAAVFPPTGSSRPATTLPPSPSAPGSSGLARKKLSSAGPSPSPGLADVDLPAGRNGASAPEKSCYVMSELRGDLPQGSTGGLESENGRSFRVGQVMVVIRHDSSPVVLQLRCLPSSGPLESAYLRRSGDGPKCCTSEWHGA